MGIARGTAARAAVAGGRRRADRWGRRLRVGRARSGRAGPVCVAGENETGRCELGDVLVRAQEGVASWAVKAGPGAVEGFGPGAGLRCGPKGKGGVGREGAGASGLGCWAWLRVEFGFLF